MLIGDANGVSGAQRAGNDVRRIARDLTDKIADEVHVEVSGIGSGGRLVGKTKAEEIQSVNWKVFSQIVEVFSPHKTRGAGADSMYENQRNARVVEPGFLIKHSPVLPVKEMRFAAESAVVRLAGATLNCSVKCGQRGHSRTARKHCLPEVS